MGEPVYMTEVVRELQEAHDADVVSITQHAMDYWEREDVVYKARINTVACGLFNVPWGEVARILQVELDEGADDCKADMSQRDIDALQWFADLCRGDVDIKDYDDYGYHIPGGEDDDDE